MENDAHEYSFSENESSAQEEVPTYRSSEDYDSEGQPLADKDKKDKDSKLP